VFDQRGELPLLPFGYPIGFVTALKGGVYILLNLYRIYPVAYSFEFMQKKGGVMVEDVQIKREIVLEADAETMEKMRKEGHARGFTVYCDERERTGGENTAPPPLAYFSLSLGF